MILYAKFGEHQPLSMEASSTEDEVAAASTEPVASSVRSATRNKPVRAPLPAHLPRERVVVPTPPCCPCCGGKLVKLGEDVTETIEVVPRQWKVIRFHAVSTAEAGLFGRFDRWRRTAGGSFIDDDLGASSTCRLR